MAKKNETPVEAVENEATVENIENEATENEATEAEQVIDLTEFEAAVDEAVAEADETTGVPADAYLSKVREVYQALPGVKAKNSAKAHVDKLLKQAVVDGKLAPARSLMLLGEKSLVAGKSTAAPKPVDPSEAFRLKVATLTLAGFLATQDVPEGIDGEAVVAEAQAQAQELFAEAVAVYRGENETEPESAIVKNAVRLAATKVRKAGKGRVATGGERRDLGAHISEAFDAVESGEFLSVAQIRAFESSVYGTDHPSAGAITNRLEPKSGKGTTVEGITVERREGKLGAVKN